MRYVILFLVLMGCVKDETVAGFLPKDTSFQLTEVNGNPAPYQANIQFGEKGRVTGSAPRNRYFATNDAPYPWFALSEIGSTKMAGPDLTHEVMFFNTLKSMTLAEVSGPVLILSNDAGQTLTFQQGS